jgi:NADH-quinone oxidoreductase subunit D
MGEKRTVELEVGTPGADQQGRPVRLPLGVADMPEVRSEDIEGGIGAEHLLINIGPQHPATHGVLRLVVELDGEVVVRETGRVSAL